MPTRTTETARVPEDISGRQRRMPVGGITWRHTFRALRHRNYRLFFWGQLVSLIGTWMQQTAMSWYVYEITNSKILLGAVAAVGSAPMMVSSIWGGSLADRHPKRTILLWTQTAQMICAFVLAFGVWLHFATPLFIIAIAAVNGVAMGFDMPARQALHRRNDQPRRFIERDFAEQLDRKRRARDRTVSGWINDRRGRCRDLFFVQWAKLYCRDRRLTHDAIAQLHATD